MIRTTKLAELLEVRQQTVRNYCSSHSQLSDKTAIRLASDQGEAFGGGEGVAERREGAHQTGRTTLIPLFWRSDRRSLDRFDRVIR